MAGITEEELESYGPQPLDDMGNGPDAIRARSVLRDIYARHGIKPGTSLEEAQRMIHAHAASKGLVDESGMPTHAWANPKEAAAAQGEYAARGNNPDEVQQRWDESIYLLPPQGYDYHQNYGRDASFLDTVENAKYASEAIPSALSSWDSSNNSRLYRKNWRQGTYASASGAPGFANVVLNTDLPTGSLVNLADVPYNFLAMQGSGEAASTRDSLRTALGEYGRREQNRTNTPAPILDIPANSSPEDRARRLVQLQQEASLASVPESAERWHRTTGVVPPPAVRDTGDAVLATLDGSQAIPGVTMGKAVKNAAKSAAMHAGRDMAVDAAISSGIAAVAGQKPNRTWSQYLGFSPEDADEVEIKTPEQVAAAQLARDREYYRTKNAMGVSTERAAEYKRLQESGKAPIQSR